MAQGCAEQLPAFGGTIESEPGELAPLRHALRAWLEAAGVEHDQTQELLLAVGEAVSNAVEHAYAGCATGKVRVDACVLDDAVEVVVRDGGRWLSRPSGSDRGRGLHVMRSLLDDVVVTPGTAGTRVELRKRLR